MATLGLIAGAGRLPFVLAHTARAAGHRVVAVGHLGTTDPALEAEVDALAWVRLGQIGKLAATLTKGGVTQAVFGGGIGKGAALTSARPDLEALKLWASLKTKGDDALLRVFADWLDARGIRIVAPGELLRECFAAVGQVAGPRASAADLEDARFGFGVCRQLGALDIGQTVAVREGMVLAVEAMEGTDACIARAGAIAAGAVVVKALKPGQDLRFDLPTIGPGTIDVLAAAKARLLAVEAGVTLVIDRDELARRAKKARISIVGLPRDSATGG